MELNPVRITIQFTTQTTQQARPGHRSTMGFLDPSPGINYDFVTSAYLVASLLCLALFVAGPVMGVDSVKGWYITLLPFPPSLLWSLVVRSRWLQQEQTKAKAE